MARRFAFLVAAVVLAVLAVVAGGPAALAHATLVSTSPAEDAIVPHAPTRVTATFDEPVGVSSDSLQVFAPNGSRADTGGTTHGSTSAQIAVALKPGLGHGTYTVGWHVISADSHPVHGAFTFSIGAPSGTSVNPSRLSQPADTGVGIAFGVVRWVAFCCFALLIGAVGFVLWCWPAGADRPLVLRLAMGAWSGLAASVLGAVLLQGAYGAGTGIGRVFWPNVLHATLYSRYGRALGIRLILVIVALFVFTAILGQLRNPRAQDRGAPVAASVTWGVLAAALAATWAAADHAGTGIQVPLSLAFDIMHLSAVALWLGGLVMLATIVLRRSPASRKRPAATAETVQAVERFSRIALACVGAILLTGTYMAWRNVGSWPALADTTYGRLLLIKIAALCVLICLGYLARIRVAAMRAPASADRVSVAELVTAGMPRVGAGARSGPPDSSTGALPESGHVAVTLRKLRWSVAAEAVIASAVLAVTAVLVNTPTARESFTRPASAAVAFNTGGPGGRGTLSIVVTPAVLGPNQIRVSVADRAGRPYSPRQIEASLVLPARHLGPLPVPLRRDGAGRYASGATAVTMAGRWQLQITIRSDAFDETTVFVPVPVQ